MDSEISGPALDTVDLSLSFLDPHNLASGSTVFGEQAEGMYQYSGISYLGLRDHDESFQTCLDCHDTHTLAVVDWSECKKCHQKSTSYLSIRGTPTDFDGDGNTSEGIAYEVVTLHQALYATLQSYAASTAGYPIVYSSEGSDFF